MCVHSLVEFAFSFWMIMAFMCLRICYCDDLGDRKSLTYHIYESESYEFE